MEYDESEGEGQGGRRENGRGMQTRSQERTARLAKRKRDEGEASEAAGDEVECEAFQRLRAEYERVRGGMLTMQETLRDPGARRRHWAAHHVLGLPWDGPEWEEKYPGASARGTARRKKISAIHPQKLPATGQGADEAKNAAEVLRQYVERASEILDPTWRAGARMGRGEAEGGDVTKVEHPMPPYGLLHAEDDASDEPRRKRARGDRGKGKGRSGQGKRRYERDQGGGR